MNREELDFQVVETQQLLPVAEALLHYRFPTTEGPLWCARLLSAGAPGLSCRPDLDAAFPHSRTLLLANHHSIADGSTNMFIASAFLSVLDDVVTGKPVDDAAELGKLVVGEDTSALVSSKLEELTNDEDRFQQIIKGIKKSKQKNKLIPRAYPMPRDPDFKSEIVLRDLNQETTQRFIRKCKKEGVTVNSGLTAVFNVGLVDFLREGLEQDFYQIQEMHSVDMRRYWSGDTSGTLGVHHMQMANVVSTPAKWRSNFWDYARSLHKSIHQRLQEKDPLMYVIAEGSPEERFVKRPSTPTCDYGLSNMGDADRFFWTEGQQVQLGHILRCSSCWRDPMYALFHTLHGCFLYSLSYANDILTREKAQKLVDMTFENLEDVIQM